jgi:methionyl-tRNA synthetase
MRPDWITATPPTPNGNLHVGHLAGPYVAADVLRRFQVAEGLRPKCTTGMDDHQNYVVIRAREESLSPDQTADLYGAEITEVWQRADVEFDRITCPRADPEYTPFAQRFFLKLMSSGAVVAKRRALPHCDRCSTWLFDGLVAGRCPHCGTPSYGGMCEACSWPNDCQEITDPTCRLCDGPATLREIERFFLPLQPYEAELSSFWEQVEMPPRVESLCEDMLSKGLPEIAISHPSNWGVPVPVDGFRGQTILPLFEMAPGFLLQWGELDDLPAQGSVNFFGFDNAYFQVALIPVLFMQFEPDLPLPRAFVVNEFFRLEGSKFSTSRRHLVTGAEALAAASSDALRFHVLANRPHGRQTDFSLSGLADTQRRLEENWNGWLQRLVAQLQTECAGFVPAEQPDGYGWPALARRSQRALEDLRDSYSVRGFDLRRATVTLDQMVEAVNEFAFLHAHCQSARERQQSIVAQLVVASALAKASAPVMPRGSRRLAELLGDGGTSSLGPTALTPLPAGRPITPTDEPLFGAD